MTDEQLAALARAAIEESRYQRPVLAGPDQFRCFFRNMTTWTPERALAALAVIEACRGIARHGTEPVRVAVAAWDALNARKP